ncbi:uncharacterized protein TNCV_4007791 [Trichonephila clavipes]|nr:uncharacterized protein TNCV_4007791 [Trichonephila clavipes]
MPHIALCVKLVLRRHFGDDRIISCHFPTASPPRFPDLNSCNFLSWGYLKAMVCRNPIPFLSDVKESIERHVFDIPQFMLLSTVENDILRFQMVADNISSLFCTLL